MATRQEIQIAQDVIRFVNIANDFIDIASMIMREIDPQTGGPLLDNEGTPFDLPAIKQKLAKIRNHIVAYWALIDGFIVAYGQANVATALNSLGVSAVTVKTELDEIRDVIQYVQNNIPSVVDKAGLIPLADYIDANTTKLPLVRRSWNVGV